MEVLAWCSLLALSLSLVMETHQRKLVGEPPQFMMPQQANVHVYRNNSLGEPQNLVLSCQLVDATDVTFEWFRFVDNPESAVRVPTQMVNPATGTLTVYSITEGEYASVNGVNYYCIATRFIGNSNYSASVRSRTITVFYASFGGFRTTTEGVVPISVAMNSDVALECDVNLFSTNPPPEIVWRFGDGNEVTEIIINNKRRFLENKRYLYIREVAASDLTSTYRCEVTNAFLDVTMQAPTTYALIDNLTRGELVEYKPIGVLTAFVGDENFEVSYVAGWHSNGAANGTSNAMFLDQTEIPSIGSISVIPSISQPTGDFALRADVRFNINSAQKSGTLRIRQLPRITSNPSDNREIVEGQDNLVYMCEFEGSPTPQISWFYNGGVIQPESGVSISDNTLTIASPRVSNSGIYQCIVTNEHGDAQASWLLEIRPSFAAQVVPYNFAALGAFDDRDLGALIVQDSGTVVNFWVDVMADPCPVVIWFFNGTQLGPSNVTFTYDDPCSNAVEGSSPNWRYNLAMMLTDETSGSYTATFTNIAGTVTLPTPAYFTVPAPVSVTNLMLSFACLKQGQDLNLRCSISGFPRPMVTFSFNGNPITPGEGIYTDYIERTFYDEIVIRNVNSSADGLYGCMADGVDPPARISREFRFCTAPNITMLTTTSNPKLGEPFFIRCTATGTPQPTISWTKDGLTLESTNDEVLRIISTDNGRTSSVEVTVGRAEFNGVYECIATALAGNHTMSTRVQLLVAAQVVPYNFTALGAFDDRDLGALIVQDSGTMVNFWVDVMADPCPVVTWFFNGTQLGPSNVKFTYDDPCSNAVEGSSPNWRYNLAVMLTDETSGSYTATFTNIAGTVTLPTPAYFTVPAPVSVTNLTLSFACLKQGQDLNLHCKISGFPRPMVTFTFNGNPITPGEGIYTDYIEQTFYDEILIRKVNSSADGLYGCMADDIDPPARFSREFRFCTAPNITMLTTTSNPKLGEPFFICCTATGIPQPTISWTKDGLTLESTDDEVLRIISTDNGRTSSVEVTVGRAEFNGVYECIATALAGNHTMSTRVQLLDINLPTESGSTIHSGTVLVVVLVSTLAILQQQTSLVSYSDIL